MMPIKTICAALAISIVSIMPIAAEEWTTTTSGGSTIEVPLSFIEGPVQVLNDGYGSFYRPLTVDMTLRQYRVDSTDHPYVYLTETLGPLVTETTLSVNEEGLGVLSGHAHDDFFYAVCRREWLGLVHRHVFQCRQEVEIHRDRRPYCCLLHK